MTASLEVRWRIGREVLARARARAHAEGRSIGWVAEAYLAAYADGAPAPVAHVQQSRFCRGRIDSDPDPSGSVNTSAQAPLGDPPKAQE